MSVALLVSGSCVSAGATRSDTPGQTFSDLALPVTGSCGAVGATCSGAPGLSFSDRQSVSAVGQCSVVDHVTGGGCIPLQGGHKK